MHCDVKCCNLELLLLGMSCRGNGSSGRQDVRVGEHQVQGDVREEQQLRQHLPGRGLPRRQVRGRPSPVHVQEALLKKPLHLLLRWRASYHDLPGFSFVFLTYYLQGTTFGVANKRSVNTALCSYVCVCGSNRVVAYFG